MLDEKIVLLKQKIIECANIVEGMLENGINVLTTRDENVLGEITAKYEPRVNEYEIELDELCANTIAQFQPRSKNLRIILMILKMNNDLERMGDHAVHVAESCSHLMNKIGSKYRGELIAMGAISGKMLKDSISAFINEDAALAKKVCETDDLIDDKRREMISELKAKMSTDTSIIDDALHMIRVSSNLERIADLSTNICEDVLYMMEGRVIKHHREETNG